MRWGESMFHVDMIWDWAEKFYKSLSHINLSCNSTKWFRFRHVVVRFSIEICHGIVSFSIIFHPKPSSIAFPIPILRQSISTNFTDLMLRRIKCRQSKKGYVTHACRKTFFFSPCGEWWDPKEQSLVFGYEKLDPLLHPHDGGFIKAFYSNLFLHYQLSSLSKSLLRSFDSKSFKQIPAKRFSWIWLRVVGDL